MKHVRESLNEFYDFQFFSRLNEEEGQDKQDKEDKAEMRDKEKDGLAVVDKITKNFEDFKKDADGEILKYKEFWEENQKAKKSFSETGSLYKMFGSDYVVGVFELPAETLSDGSIDGGMGATDEPEEEIIEGKEIGTDEAESEEVGVNEAEGEEDDLSLDLDIGEPTGAAEAPAEAPAPEAPLEMPAEAPAEAPVPEAPAEEMPEPELMLEPEAPTPDLAGPQKYFVVYDAGSGKREEILRTGSNNVVSAFDAFYNDTFKGAMKDIIVQYQEQKKVLKAEAEKTEKVKVEKDKESKIEKFLGEGQKPERVDEELNEAWVSVNNDAGEPTGTEYQNEPEDPGYGEDSEEGQDQDVDENLERDKFSGWTYEEGDRVRFEIKDMSSEWKANDPEGGEAAEAHDGMEAVITARAMTNSEAGEPDKDFEYYDIQFRDGEELDAVSGYHLEPMDEEDLDESAF